MNLELIKQKIKIHNNSEKNNIMYNSITITNNKHSIGTIKHYPPSIDEWYNSIYTFNKNKYMDLLPAIDGDVYILLKSYFNMNPSHKLWMKSNKDFKLEKTWIRRLSIKSLFISKPKIKHSNSKVIINTYIYNRKKLYYINKLAKLIKIYNKFDLKTFFNQKSLYKSIGRRTSRYPKYRIKLLRKEWKKKTNIFIAKIKNRSFLKLFTYLKYFVKFNSKKWISKTRTVRLIKKLDENKKRYLKKIYLYKYYISMLYFNSYLFNTNNLLPLNHILKKIYPKKIELNIINLKYLYLDSNILAEAITKKLKDRKKRVLRVLKLGLKLTKKPFFKIHFHKDILDLNYLFKDKKLIININYLNNDITKNRYLVNKPNIHKTRLVLYHMKHKIISGIRLEGTGRLTKRLTASRSISKYKYIGSLKNLNSSYQGLSTIMLRGFVKSNLQYVNINNYNRNGSFGIKVSVSVY